MKALVTIFLLLSSISSLLNLRADTSTKKKTFLTGRKVPPTIAKQHRTEIDMRLRTSMHAMNN